MEIKELDNSEEYQKRDSLINKLKLKIKDVEQQLFDKDIYYKEQLDSITNIIKQKDDYLQQYMQLNTELLDKIETMSNHQSQYQQFKEDNEQLFSDLQQKQEIIDRLQKQLNIEDKNSLYLSQCKDEIDEFKQNMMDKLNSQISILTSDNSILKSQIKSLQAENDHLTARVNTLLFAQNKNSLISFESPSATYRHQSARDSEIKNIQKQMSHYASIVHEIQNDDSPTNVKQMPIQSGKNSINEIQSTYRDSGRQQQSFVSSDYNNVASHRQFDVNFQNNNKQILNSNNNSLSKYILTQDVL